MLIRIRTCKSNDLRKRFDYLLREKAPGEPRDPEKCRVVYRDAPEEVFVEAAKNIKRKEVYYSLIVSFHPKDKEKYLDNRERIIEDLKEELFRGYPEDNRPMVHIVEHLDEKHPHLHLTVLNDVNGKAARFWYHRRDLAWLNSVQAYLRRKYDLTDPRSPEHQATLHENRSRARAEALARLERKAAFDQEARRRLREIRTRDQLRREVNRLAEEAYMSGLVRDREELVEHFKGLGLKVPRTGRDYVTVALQTEGGKELRIRLRGSIYEDGFSVTEGPGEAKRDLSELRRRIEEAGQSRFSDLRKRFGLPGKDHGSGLGLGFYSGPDSGPNPGPGEQTRRERATSSSGAGLSISLGGLLRDPLSLRELEFDPLRELDILSRDLFLFPVPAPGGPGISPDARPEEKRRPGPRCPPCPPCPPCEG